MRKDFQDSHDLSINDACIIGAYTAGIGFTGLKSILNVMEMDFMSHVTYRSAETKLGARLREIADHEMRQAAEDEKAIALADGKFIIVDSEKYGQIRVVVDGGWAKRTYGHSFNSNAGVGVILGAKTNKSTIFNA